MRIDLEELQGVEEDMAPGMGMSTSILSETI
jgi:hypothetical protein